MSASTLRAYTAFFREYLAFMIFNKCQPNQVNLDFALAFLEFLATNKVKIAQIRNYVAAMKHFSIRFNISYHCWKHEKIALFLKALQRSTSFRVRLPRVLDITLFEQLIAKCRLTYLGDIFKAAYILAFFGFFRLSNLVPHTVATFSKIRHLTKGDIFFSKNYVTTLIKRAKTIQNNDQVRLIKLPVLKNRLCPAKILKECLALVPGDKDAPLLQFKIQSNWVPLTDNKIRSHLKTVLQFLNLPRDYITFHSFRRSVASFAFNLNVPLQHIQRHGTWMSDSVWRYVTDSSEAGVQVADSFASYFCS